MAGLGFKDFAVGEVLTSADVDGYLMQQTVMRFADAGARGSALGTASGTGVPLAEGMLSYLDSLDVMQVYDGSNWRDPSIGIGSNVVQAVKTNAFTSTSTSFADVPDLSVTITPTSAASKILLILNTALANNTSGGVPFVVVTDSSNNNIISVASGTQYDMRTELNSTRPLERSTIVALVSPATTSAVTYKTRMASSSASFTACLNRNGAGDTFTYSTFTAIEVAA